MVDIARAIVEGPRAVDRIEDGHALPWRVGAPQAGSGGTSASFTDGLRKARPAR